ncbi:MAG: hypothetical protein FJW36_19650 [Acidobacteria bacterium]|nr:hypothetical protein [Acidobacteriota bacterium]
MRKLIPLVFLILSACTTEKKPFELPKQTEGGWKLTASQPFQAAEWITRLGMKNATRASYTGPINTEVYFYELKSESAALECMQRWRTNPGESHFFKGDLFVVIRSDHPNRETKADFTRALQKLL